MQGAGAAVVAEVAGGPVGRVQLLHVPAAAAGLAVQGGDEAVDGGGVLQVPEKLAAAGPPGIRGTRSASGFGNGLRRSLGG